VRNESFKEAFTVKKVPLEHKTPNKINKWKKLLWHHTNLGWLEGIVWREMNSD